MQEKKAMLIMIPCPSQYMASTLNTSRADVPAKPTVQVIRQEYRGLNSSRKNATTWIMDQRKEMSRRMV